ncbi:MAG: ferrochelatase [Bacteroidota bacterium]
MAFSSKTGVLIVNLGTPDAPSRGAVYRYLKEFLLDPRVIDIPWLPRNILVRGIIAPFRSGSSAKLYKMLWLEEGSPLKIYGERLTEGVQELLGGEYHVELGMRYQNPSIASAIDRLLQHNISRLIVLPLFPQYASATTGSVHEEVMRVLATKQSIPDVRLINSYYAHPAMIDVFCHNARKFDLKSYDHILFSFHGLPQRQLRKGDASGSHCLKKENCCESLGACNQFCYSAQCYQTAYAIADQLGIKREQYTICFQSRLGRDPWVQPYTSSIIEEQAEKGAKRMLVFCPAFVSDCLETTIEITYEYAEEFEEMGGEQLDLVPGLNDHPQWIKTVKDLVLENA